MSTTNPILYVYDVDPEGGCVQHFAIGKPEGVYVGISVSVMPPGFFKMQEAMHQRMGHTLVVEVDNEHGTVWSVRIGKGDFQSMLQTVKQAMLDTIIGGPFDVSQN